MINKHKLELETVSSILNDTTEQPTPIIDNGILTDKTLLLISGQQKVGKSMFAYNCALAIATGRDFAGFKIIKPRRVMILSAEGGRFLNRDRLKKMCKARKIETLESLVISRDTRIKLDDDESYNHLKKTIKDFGPDVVIIDPLVKFHCAEENSAKEMSAIMERIRMLIEDHNLAVILIHHNGKIDSGGPRGSSVIMGEYDSYVDISKKDDGVRLEFDMRHVETPDPIKLRLNRDTLWFESIELLDPVVAVVKEKESISRPDLIKLLLEKGRFETSGGAYKAIKKAIAKGNIDFKDGIFKYRNN